MLIRLPKFLSFLLILGIAVLSLSFIPDRKTAGYTIYNDQVVYIHIPSYSSFEQVYQRLHAAGLVKNKAYFSRLANQLGYKKFPMRSGRFALRPGMSYRNIILHLKEGKQTPVKVVLHNERRLVDVANKISRFIEPSGTALLSAFRDPALLKELGYTKEDVMTLFLPNTYEVYWNSSPEQFLRRMKKEYDRFWNINDRNYKAGKLRLSKSEIYILASIIEKETLRNDEKSRMAGVFFNRLQKNMRLQADPTAVFARQDFGARQVTEYHTEYDSPYNTYRYAGLPPGPICLPSIVSIDAVLDLEKHDYVYFCAKGDGSGYHVFAKTLKEHYKNAAQYRKNKGMK